jgi:tetratricopeptide (TPR) repeat protein
VALAAYADQFSRALGARFNPALGDMTLADAAKARFLVELEFRRGGPGVVTRITLRERAGGVLLGVREVAEPLAPASSISAIMQASAFVKPVALRREREIAQARPERNHDARDDVTLALTTPKDRAHVDEAVRLATAARSLAPKGVLVRETLASALDLRLMNGWSADPQADMARLRALDAEMLGDNPDSLQALQNLSDLYVLQGRWEDALVASDRVLAFRPEDPIALLNRGQAQLMLGAAPAADASLARLFDFPREGPLGVTINQFGGELRFHQGRAAEAAEFFRRSIQLTPPDDLARPAFAGVRLYLAAAEAEQGRLSEARQALDDFRAAAPQVRTTQAFLKWNDMARFPLVDTPRLAADLAKAGMPER